nr:hypothetical protein BaRGS_019655 [Batillaria attramentaria]
MSVPARANRVKTACVCALGYSGDQCQTHICNTASNPCQNGATCNPITTSPGYTCSCTTGYSDICSSASQPCQNGATCSPMTAFPGYSCACTTGFTGTNCENFACQQFGSICGTNGVYIDECAGSTSRHLSTSRYLSTSHPLDVLRSHVRMAEVALTWYPDTLVSVPLDTQGKTVKAEFTPWDNPDNLVSYAVEELLELVVNGVALPVLFLVSLPTNIISAIVFYRQGLQERINLCVFSLSLVDMLYVVFAFCLFSDRLYSKLTGGPRFGHVAQFIFKNKLVGFFHLNSASWFITTLIASERCFCVVSPLTSKTVLKTRSTAAVLIVSFVVIVTGGFVAGLSWDVACVLDPVTNLTSTFTVASEFYIQTVQLIDVLEGVVFG